MLRWNYDKPEQKPKVIIEKTNRINRKLAVSGDEQWMVCVGNSGTIDLINLLQQSKSTKIQLPVAAVYDVAFIGNSKQFLCSGSDSTLYYYNGVNIAPVKKHSGRAFAMHPMKGSVNKNLFAIGYEDGVITMLEPENG